RARAGAGLGRVALAGRAATRGADAHEGTGRRAARARRPVHAGALIALLAGIDGAVAARGEVTERPADDAVLREPGDGVAGIARRRVVRELNGRARDEVDRERELQEVAARHGGGGRQVGRGGDAFGFTVRGDGH